MAKRKSRKIIINAPKYHDPGKGRPREELAYISPREKRGLLNSTDHTAEMTKHGVLSFADDSASSKGVSRGDASQDTVGSSGKQQSSANAATGSSNYGGGSTKQSGSSNSTGSQNYGGGSTKQSGSSNSTGSQNYGGGVNTSSGSGSAQSKSNNAATGPGNYGGGTKGGQQKSGNAATGAGGYGDGSNNAGGMGQNPAQGTPASPGMSTPSSSTQGGLLGRNPAVGPAQPGMSTPGSALLNATRAPKSINDRIQPDRTDPLSDANNRVPGSTLDPTNPIGRPATLEQLKKGYNVDPGFNSPEARWQQHLNELRAPEGGTTAVDEFGQDVLGRVNYKGRVEAASQNIASPFADPNVTPTIDDVKAWGRQVIAAAKQMGLPKGHTSIGPYQTTTTNIGRIANELNIPGDTPLTSDVYNEIATQQIKNNPTLSDWNESLSGKKQRDLAAGFADSTAPDYSKSRTGVLTPDYSNEGVSAFNNAVSPQSPEDTQQGIRDAITGRGAFSSDGSPFGGASPAPSGKGNYGDPSAPGIGDPGPSISPAGYSPKDPSRLSQDPNFNPSTDNPTPLGLANKQYGDRLLGNTLSDTPDVNDFVGMPKVSTAQIPETAPAPKQIVDRISPSSTGLLSPTTRGRLPNLGEKAAQPEPLPEDTNQFMPEVLTRPPVGLPSPPIPRNKPQLGPVYDNAATTRHRYNQFNVPKEEQPPAPRLNVDTEPETAPVDITNYGSWPKNLPPSTGMPDHYGIPDRLPHEPPAEQPADNTPVDIAPHIPVDVDVKNNVVKQYGPDMAVDILTTVAAVKRAMGNTGTKGGKQGIGRLTHAPRKGKRRNINIPEDAPRLGA